MEDSEYVKIWNENGIGHVVFEEIDDIDYEKAREYISKCIRDSHFKPMPVLVDLRKVKGITPQATKYLVTEEAEKITKASAVLINPVNPIVSMGISFLLKIERQPYPIKFFYEEAPALEWLQQYVEKKDNPAEPKK